jgi:uncharacterized OB-fold protein
VTAAKSPDVEVGAAPASRSAITAGGESGPASEGPEREATHAADGAIAASHCPRCGRTCAPPARFCPDDGTSMTPTTVPAHGEVVSFTTLYSPPTGFASPLHLALVQLSGGTNFFCHGAGTKGLRLGSRVTIEAVDDIYYFSTLSLAGRAALFWRRRAETATGRLSAFVKSAAQRLLRKTP